MEIHPVEFGDSNSDSDTRIQNSEEKAFDQLNNDLQAKL